MNMYLNKIRRSVGFSYERNSSLRLVLTLAGFFIGLKGLYIIIMVLSENHKAVLTQTFLPAITLQSFAILIQKPWIIISHMLYHNGFWEFITNMVWLYLFSNIIQSLVGYKEIIPIYVISSIIAALGLLGIQEFAVLNGTTFLAGSYPAIFAMAMACMVLAPKYRIYISERLSFPVWAAVAVYIVLNLAVSLPNNLRLVVWMSIGGLVGAVYMSMLKNGWAIGNSLYNFKAKFSSVTNDTSVDTKFSSASQQLKNKQNNEIDAILDKIHQKGYLSLSAKEKEALEQYSKDL